MSSPLETAPRPRPNWATRPSNRLLVAEETAPRIGEASRPAQARLRLLGAVTHPDQNER